MNMIVVKLGLHKERHKKCQECDILSLLYSTMLYALIVHNFLHFPKAPDPIKEKSWKYKITNARSVTLLIGISFK